jgi:hypothetical protein
MLRLKRSQKYQNVAQSNQLMDVGKSGVGCVGDESESVGYGITQRLCHLT